MQLHRYDIDGNFIETIDLPDPEPSQIEQAIATARQEIQSLSPTGATRQAIEALITAIEALI